MVQRTVYAVSNSFATHGVIRISISAMAALASGDPLSPGPSNAHPGTTASSIVEWTSFKPCSEATIGSPNSTTVTVD